MRTLKKFLGGILSFVILLTIPTASVFAYQGDNYSSERHEAMELALETNDYDASAELMGGKGHMTDEDFSMFIETHDLAEEGEEEEAKAICAELGMDQEGMSQKGQNNK